MCNRNNAHETDHFTDEKITKRNEPTNQAQTKITLVLTLAKGLKYI